MSAAKVSCETREDRALSRTKMSPALRFKGFEGEWRRQPLDFVAEINPRTEIPSEFEYVDLESVVGTNLISSRKVTRDVAPSRAQRLASPGDVFFQTVRPYQKNNYFFPGSDKPFVFSSGYAQLKPIIAGRYLFCAIQAPRFVNDVLVNCTGSSYPAIAPSALREIDMAYPSDENEACEIGSCLTNFDFFLKERQSALEKLEALKKSMLVNMFPQGDAKVPKIRFKGFEGEWKDIRLGDEGRTYNGLSGKTRADFGHGKGKYVTYMNVFGNPISKPEQCESVEIDTRQNEVRSGDVFFTTSSETPEEVGMSSVWLSSGKNTYLNSFCFGYRPHGYIDSKFLAYLLRSMSFREMVVKLAQGISRFNISKGKVMDIRLLMPEYKEQVKIGKYFNSLVQLIAARRDEIEQLKRMKAALLDRMFV